MPESLWSESSVTLFALFCSGNVLFQLECHSSTLTLLISDSNPDHLWREAQKMQPVQLCLFLGKCCEEAHEHYAPSQSPTPTALISVRS